MTVPSVGSDQWLQPQLVERGRLILMGMEVFGKPLEGNQIGTLWERFETVWDTRTRRCASWPRRRCADRWRPLSARRATWTPRRRSISSGRSTN
jgi:hypothetical protein